jgi:hypothetical protein
MTKIHLRLLASVDDSSEVGNTMRLDTLTILSCTIEKNACEAQRLKLEEKV